MKCGNQALLAALAVSLLGCPHEDGSTAHTYDLPTPRGCLAPEEWIDVSCDQYCRDQDLDLVCSNGERCEGGAALGFKRLDACYGRDTQYAQPLGQSCTEPLPESLTDSVYYVTCCCVREQ